jgi:hypothetical protein
LFPLFGSSLDLRLVPVLPGSDSEVLRVLAASRAQILATLPGGQLDQMARRDPRHFRPLYLPPVPGRQRLLYAAVYRIES